MGQEAFISSGAWFFLVWALICPVIAIVANYVQMRNEKSYLEEEENDK